MKFSNEVIAQLQNYVYRLIDPRTGNTFYVGRGKGNRIFAHVNDALSNFAGEDFLTKEEKNDDLITKISTIREITSKGLKVLYLIHRWGMSESEAKEVEAALIDAYPGLQNIASGYNSERGVTSIKEINEIFEAEVFNFDEEDKFLIFKIGQLKNNELGNYAATRGTWVLNLARAKQYKVVLSVISSIVREVYIVDEWYRTPNSKTRIEFRGKRAPDNIRAKYINKKIPETFRKKGSANPVQYSS